jgi:polyferredoxin
MVAKSFGEMSEQIDHNLSVSGDQSQEMSWVAKLSIALIVIGVLTFGWALFKDIKGLSYLKIIGFLMTASGSGLFFSKKWYLSAGSILFVLGLVGIYYGYIAAKEIRYSYAIYGFASMVAGSMLFTYDPVKKFDLASQYTKNINWTQKIGLLIAMSGVGIMLVAWLGKVQFNPSWLYLTITLAAMAIGILIYTYGTYAGHTAGIKNNYVMFNSVSSRGVLGFIVGILLTVFYIQIYWNEEGMSELISLFDSLSYLRRGKAADQWFVYGTLYSFIILFLGIKFIIKYRHSRYHLIRTIVVILSQLILADLIPSIMEAMNYTGSTAMIDGKSTYLGYYTPNPVQTWPLNYGAYKPETILAQTHAAHQPVGMAYFFWGLIMFLVVTPIVTYYVGKRWYCSWFCGCGGLAETAGDSFRHLSNKSVKAWKIERWVIHSVMVFVLLMTMATLYSYLTSKEFELGFFTLNKNTFYIIISVLLIICAVVLYLGYSKYGKKNKFLLIGSIIFIFILVFLNIAYFSGGKDIFMISSTSIKKAYGFFIGAAFSGVIGVGFYPILGNRVWCRFGCPMAGYMGLFQRFKSRFRITTNGSQCISCGNCSTYCEQGIDVRAYAQKGENIVRASCVGCGVCSSVCPRGVLKLENGPEDGRFEPNPLEITKDGVKLNH